MLHRVHVPVLLVVPIVVTLARVAECVTLNQIDTFQGSKNNWTDGHAGDNLAVIANGGPNGAGDGYLQVSSGSAGGEPRLITFNQNQWTGNYIAAHVKSISMELKNFGLSTLPIRIAIRNQTGGAVVQGYSSTNAFMLPADGNWHLAQFKLDNANMTATGAGLPPLLTELLTVADFRLLSAAQPAIIGDAISARIGVDDITAVPEPASYILLAVAGAALIAWRAIVRRCR
jgi:hypothetical protein